MLFKLSIKNIKKSIKDYSIYFFTLIIAVSIFYMFNSIDAQSTMLALNNSKYDIIQSLIVILDYVSVFVSIILGFLIVYSNNFLIKRRKKEIGLYQILGMNKRKVSFILVLETLLIGIISLAVGLIVGICLSQFLSIFVSKIFAVDLTEFRFVFSATAFNKTMLYFGIIYLLVVIFNTITLSRYKIIDLINAEKKNEKVKIRNKYLTIITFILSLCFVGYAYYLLLNKNVLLMMDENLWIMIASGALGTFLMFFSLSGFLLKVLERTKRIYYKGLNIFTLKQVNSKINTSVVSTTIICLMLLLTIGMLSGSMSLARVFNTNFSANNLTDFTVKLDNTLGYVNYNYDVEMKKVDFVEMFEKEVLNTKEIEKFSQEYVYIHKYYDKSLNAKNLINKEDLDLLEKTYGSGLQIDYAVPIMKESEYKRFMEINNLEYVDIKSNEYLLLANIDLVVSNYTNHYKDKTPITINGKKLIPGSGDLIEIALENSTSDNNDGIIVVSDEIVKGLDLLTGTLVGNLIKGDNEDSENEFYNYIQNKSISFEYRTRTSMEASSLGIKTIVTFIGLYLGITFAISSATVLAIGQLSESSDNKKRFKVLSQIGADNKMINKALFTQIAITFLFPLVVALIHAFFGLREVNSLLISFGEIDLTSNILLTTLFMVVVYGGYFLVTYLCSKSIIKND